MYPTKVRSLGFSSGPDEFWRTGLSGINAGILHKDPLADTLASDFDRVVAVNLRGSFLNAREIVGTSATDVSYDIDFVDPAFAPGTGTPEVGGPDSFLGVSIMFEMLCNMAQSLVSD